MIELELNDPFAEVNPIPEAMRSRKQWLVWNLETRNGKPSKIPYQVDGTNAKTNTPSTWTDYESCKAAVDVGRFHGTGFVFAEGDGFCGIDLDHCVDGNGNLSEWAIEILEIFAGTYIERSPSGDGFHIFCRAKIPKAQSRHRKDWIEDGRKQGVEFYDFRSPRYFTVTGDAVSACDIVDMQDAIDWLYCTYFMEEETPPAPARESLDNPDSDLVREALRHISSDDYETWLRVGMGLKMSGYGFELFDEWSSSYSGYSQRECQSKWNSFRNCKVTIGTIFHLAKQGGFVRPSKVKPGEGVSIAARADEIEAEEAPPPGCPVLPAEALHGLAGEFTLAATEESEADPAAVLIGFLARYGCTIGPRAHTAVAYQPQRAKLFAVLAGASSKGRKGTSNAPVEAIFKLAESIAADRGFSAGALAVVPGPLSTGEGLIARVRDESEETDNEGKPKVAGVKDKRLLVLSEEMAAAFKASQREGNTLSPIIRTLWDDTDVEPLTKTNRIKTTGSHISILSHITTQELKASLNSTEIFNGFANRFLWVFVRRQKIVPLPKKLDPALEQSFAERLAHAIEHGFYRDAVEMDERAAYAWGSNTHRGIYHKLTRCAPGIAGAITARSEPQVLRIALIYALLDGDTKIRVTHLQAACALWSFCEASAQYIFAFTPDADPQKILEALKAGPKTQTELHKLFHGKNKKLSAQLKDLESIGLIQRSESVREGFGPPTITWTLAN